MKNGDLGDKSMQFPNTAVNLLLEQALTMNIYDSIGNRTVYMLSHTMLCNVAIGICSAGVNT